MIKSSLWCASLAGASLLTFANLAPAVDVMGYTNTPLVPGQKWHVHDPDRTRPRVVAPGESFSHKAPAPADAVVLFDGTDLSKWRGNKGEAKWKVENGYMEVAKGAGNIYTKDEFSDFQLHIEFATPTELKGSSQGRGNSGVFLMGAFEIQVLDSYQNPTYADGSAGSMYGQFPPLVNASRKPGLWQAYDIIFTAPRFKATGELDTPAVVTVLHNGVLIHNATAFYGPTQHKRIDPYSSKLTRGPLLLQDHGNPVRFRNIWVREIKNDE